MSRDPDRRVMRVVFWVLLAGGALVMLQLWLPLLMAIWFAHLTSAIVAKLERWFGGRRRLAAAVVLLFLVLLFIPVSAAVASLVVTGTGMVRKFIENPELRDTLRSIVSGDDAAATGSKSLTELFDPRRIVAVLQEHGAAAWGALKSFFGATAEAVVQIFAFFLATYAFIVYRDAPWRWAVDHAPLDARHMERLRAAFHETGRGLLFGVGLTAASQAVVATIAYTALGVPRAFTLGQLTFFAAFIPTFGTAIIWVPVAAGLALSGQLVKALILAGIGTVVVGSIDNLLNPLFSRWGRLDVPAFVLILSIFGGFAVFGPWGFILGPLAVRMAREALEIARDEKLY
jgi:predicted PurR-regulated permease PerM